jgi:CheY-like chemotaxis protein
MLRDTEKYKGKSILVVEDDNISRTLLKEIFRNTSVSIDFVKSGTEAIAYFEEKAAPNLVLMDIRLPDIDGIELTKRLISKHPQLVIVAQTAFANLNMEDKCINAGMKAFLTKPINTNEVERVLTSLDW